MRQDRVLLGIAIRSVAAVAVGLMFWGPADPVDAEWSRLPVNTSYTNDAFQFSAARRLAFSEDPSQPTIVSLEKSRDVIWEPALELIQSANTSAGKNELSMKAQAPPIRTIPSQPWRLSHPGPIPT